GLSAREHPRSLGRVDCAIDIGKLSVAESPAARFKFLELHRNSESAHGPLSVPVEIAFEVAQPQSQIGIDGLARAERRVVRFGDAAPHPFALVKREAMAVICYRVDSYDTLRLAT